MLLESSSGVEHETGRLHRNEATQMMPALEVRPYRPLAVRDVFLHVYEKLRPALLAARAPCYVLAAARPPAYDVEVLALPLVPGECSDAIVGRHDRCDLVLPSDPCVALRHMLVRGYLDEAGAPRVRLLDLGSRTGFLDESAKLCTGLTSDGHLFATLGQYSLLALLCLPDSRWPEDAAEAWAQLPERRLLGSCTPDTQRRRPLEPRPRLRLVERDESGSRRRGHHTTITRLPGPLHLQDIDESSERGKTGIASLVFPRQQGDLSVQLTAGELEDGVLVGRYERCQLGTWPLEPSAHISRVHLCLLLDETGLWAIDTASSNGTKCNGEKLRSARLGDAATLRLAHSLTVRWMRG